MQIIDMNNHEELWLIDGTKPGKKRTVRKYIMINVLQEPPQ